MRTHNSGRARAHPFKRARCTCAKHLTAAVIAVLVPLSYDADSAAAQPLTLRQALTLARDADLGLPAAAARIEAAAGAILQAGFSPNPLVGADVENLPRTSFHTPFERTEVTLYYQRLIERGGKLEARTNVARADLEVARLRRVVRALDLFAQVEVRWAEAVAAEAAVATAEEQLTATLSLQVEVNRRVEAARDPLFAGTRIDTQVAQAQIALDQSRTIAQNARAALFAYFGPMPSAPLEPSELENIEVDVSVPMESPDIALLETIRDVASAQIALERARPVPDVTLRGGVRYLESGGGLGRDLALVIGGSIPLGINDTNQGNIERAQAERLAAEREIMAARLNRMREIARLQANLTANATEVRRIEAEVLPKAEETVTLVRDGFSRGGFSYIDVIDAQRALIDSQRRRIDVLRAFQIDRAALDRLIGAHADLVASEETRP